MRRWRRGILLSLFLLALFLRVDKLGTLGLSEDEARKVIAIEQIKKGNLSANAEHPLLLKSAINASLEAGEKVNFLLGRDVFSPEFLVRAPTALLGALTVIPVYLLAEELFGSLIGTISAYFFAVGVSAISFNRIGKEDTFIVFFFTLACYFLLKGRRSISPVFEYYRAGAYFGLAYASKYLIPYIWIPLFYYDILYRRGSWLIERRTWLSIFLIAGIFFLIANPFIVHPATLSYIKGYFLHQRIIHHGYFMMGKLYHSKPVYTFFGVPWYFYPLFLGVKVPLSLLFFFAFGLFYLLRRWKEEGALFVLFWFFLWLFLLSISGGKYTRYVLELLPSFYIIAASGAFFLLKWIFERGKALRAVLTVLLGLVLLHPLLVSAEALPFERLYLNQMGRGKTLYYFPQDELYGTGFREAVSYIARNGERGAFVISDANTALRYYLKRFNRPDLSILRLCSLDLTLERGRVYYIILYQGERYFENDHYFRLLPQLLRPVYTVRIKGHPVAWVFKVATEADWKKVVPLTEVKNRWRSPL